ncbi:hypothetical protein VOLCADRAFT_94983 [Volvox carteri f. nagariensis]|uniref:Uncharacterized protein n=1 Tax=Volvox carteri f. nagariensis TaxID=3068 RepID=D8U6A5_VOLCA|nr:uncharacterized protein VOLCADRAFT_94983 [Volvox carteri f. nagariensis]EFJ44613.1 hypothetical protein VOLCADRAFT_94983 [Volvox carteri f. nagariensis]|eukprot:XP_002954189.1 hypothetical protein VOLCADRAFT_94983 [Volvox carteri f. nagariensis]
MAKAFSPNPNICSNGSSKPPSKRHLLHISPRGYINSVRLMGSILQPERQGRCTSAIIHVPYATNHLDCIPVSLWPCNLTAYVPVLLLPLSREGGQDFVLEAWNEEAALLLGLHGAQVLVDGRLARDAVMGVTKVVANSIQLVDLSLPVTSYRGGQAGERRTAAPALDPQQVWRTHYTSSTQTLKALAAHFGVQPSTISRSLLPYAFQSSSPLHWRVLAEEVGLGPKDDLRLGDFMDLVTKYKEDVAAMYGEAKPGAAPPPMPTTAEGILKVKPIREWALAKPETDLAFYTVKQYEAQHGMPMLYEALRMAVVAEATQGVWNYQVEFGSGVEA